MIKDLRAREIIDSRGNPTIEVSLFTDNGVFVSSVPSGASTGSYEAKELRDGGERYNGKGVLRAVENVNSKIKPLLINKEIEPFLLDELMCEVDGTEDKSNFGANAILGVSMCLFRAKAAEEGKELFDYLAEKSSSQKRIPKPCFNIINGGVHGGGGVDFQEFMIVPQESSFSKNLQRAVEFSHTLKDKIIEDYGVISTNVGDEGGFVPNIETEKEVLSLLKNCDFEMPIIIDVASTEFYKGQEYLVKGKIVSREELINRYKELSQKFNLLGFEDPLYEDDFSGWGLLRKEIGDILIIGDDLLVTNPRRMDKAKENNSCNAMILKINQIGSITEALEAVKKAKEFGWKIIVSHRSGETNDNFIADFAVGVGAEYIKAGAPKRGERLAKYNRLLQIEELI